MNTAEKEKLIIDTVLYCNTEIKNLFESTKIMNNSSVLVPLFEKQIIYEYNMKNLNENFDSQVLKPYITNNNNRNYYAYFNKVNSFLSTFELGIQKSLNESLQIDGTESDNNVDIFSFKNDLSVLISELEKQNDINKYNDPDILKIKTDLKQPLFVHGYNISNNLNLQKELHIFGISKQDIYEILYDNTNKLLIFVCSSNLIPISIIAYDIKTDNFLRLNDYVFDYDVDISNITITNYNQIIKNEINSGILSVYINTKALKFEFKNNIMNDFNRAQNNKRNNKIR